MLQLAEHFGTATGAKVRRWCERWGWPLVWSTGGGHGSAMVAAADRVLDLSLVGRNTSRLNVTVFAAAVAAFDPPAGPGIRWRKAGCGMVGVASRARGECDSLKQRACSWAQTLTMTMAPTLLP